MALTSPLWADIERDVADATAYVRQAAERVHALTEGGSDLPVDLRQDREWAVGYLLHNAYGAIESGLEKLIIKLDGDRPAGSDYHAQLIRRAALPIAGLRPAIISETTAASLQALRGFRHVFRHVYGGFDYRRAVVNLPIAEQVILGLADELPAFARAMGML